MEGRALTCFRSVSTAEKWENSICQFIEVGYLRKFQEHFQSCADSSDVNFKGVLQVCCPCDLIKSFVNSHGKGKLML